MSEEKEPQKIRLVLIAYIFLTIGILIVWASSQWEYQIGEHVSAVLLSLGSTLISISLISVVYEHFMKESFIKSVKQKLGASLEEKFATINKLESSGIENVHANFPLEEIQDHFSKAQTRIRILQTWIPEIPHLLEAMKLAQNNGCDIEILLIKPKSDQAIARSKDLECDVDHRVSSKVDNTLDDIFRDLESHYKETFNVRLYSGTPTMAVYSSDESFFLSLYCRKCDSAKAPHIEIGGERTLFGELITKHFDSIWKTAEPFKPR